MDILNNQLSKLSITFLIGFTASYFVFDSNNGGVDHSFDYAQVEPEEHSQDQQDVDAKLTASVTKKYEPNIATSRPQKSVQQLELKIEKLQQQVESLKQKLVAREEHKQNKNTLAQQSNQLEPGSDKNSRVEALTNRVRKLLTENKRLKENLSELQPQRISDEQLIAAVSVPKQFEQRFKRLKGKMREEIYDFHQKEEDPNWGADKQLAISDFIHAHEHGPEVNIVSIICKIDTCELMLEEKTNLKTLMEEGMDRKEARELLNSREPFYRQIIRDLGLSESLNLQLKFASSTNEKTYVYLIEKRAVDQQ